MKIEVVCKPAVIVFLEISNELIKGFNFREHSLIETQKLPVEVFTTVTSPKISKDNTVWIHHWHYTKLKILQQLVVPIVGEEGSYKSLNHM
jgi:hypothetical protein